MDDFTGKIESVLPSKAVVVFKRNGNEERALAIYDKVKINGMNFPEGGKFEDYIKEGTTVSFSAHPIDFAHISGPIRCSWFATQISNQEVNRNLFPYLNCDELGINGLRNKTGTVKFLALRQGILTYKTEAGFEEKVLFLASKLYIHGKRFKSNFKSSDPKHQMIEEGSDVYFDAVPCLRNENEYGCVWFATVVWARCKKPRLNYDVHDRYMEDASFLEKIKLMASNPRSLFIRGEGRISSIINEEYGIALGMIRPNLWQSILFHRSMCFLFNINLSTKDLQKVFEKGDRIKFIAVPAPKKYIAQLIATQIGINVHPTLAGSTYARKYIGIQE